MAVVSAITLASVSHSAPTATAVTGDEVAPTSLVDPSSFSAVGGSVLTEYQWPLASSPGNKADIVPMLTTSGVPVATTTTMDPLTTFVTHIRQQHPDTVFATKKELEALLADAGAIPTVALDQETPPACDKCEGSTHAIYAFKRSSSSDNATDTEARDISSGLDGQGER